MENCDVNFEKNIDLKNSFFMAKHLPNPAGRDSSTKANLINPFFDMHQHQIRTHIALGLDEYYTTEY